MRDQRLSPRNGAPSARVEELFNDARRQPEGLLRRRFLERACGDDDALRRQVEKLLASADDAEVFFQDGRSMVAATVAPLQSLAKVTASDAEGTDLLAGERIGRYKLIEKLGEGGCGVVYVAEQEEPVRRRVALKIIRLGMETRSVIARFEAERQALAMMDHPNIARVFDAGATEHGPPYFIMELVRGVPVTRYADQSRLTIRQRLELFVQVCHAIQHAHQKGIVHGDIKPSNIIVALHDGRPVPKVIDFGISRATEARLTDERLFSAYAQLVGTPAYMSPEQAEMGGLDIDTRSDIYSLGVLLYELLTGRTPFEAQDLLVVGLEEMRAILREREPLVPSARLAALPADLLQSTATARQLSPSRLVSRLRGDLDWIVRRALQKERGRRYETANGFAVDVQRYLDEEPVVARPTAWTYRLSKLVRRNRAVFLAGSAVTVALASGFGTSTHLFLKEREARERAVEAEQQQALLLREAEQRGRITQAALLVSQERFAEADALLSELAVVEPTMEGAAVFRAVGEWHALHNRWRQAADRFKALLDVNQLEGSDMATMDCLRAGPALLEIGGGADFEQFRDRAIARFTASPCPFADRIVKVALLQAGPPRLLESLEPLAQSAADALAAADASGDTFTAAWRSLSMSLLEYRRGHYAEALRWSRRCLAYPEPNAPRIATARLLAAMASYQLGRLAEARQDLVAGLDMIETKIEGGADRGSPVHGFWFDWAFARILLREAQALIGTPL